MARRLGISLSGYRYWERGERTPRGRWLLRLRDLCPDPETRLLFGGTKEPVGRQRSQPGAKATASESRRPWDAYRKAAISAIEAVYAKAADGDAAAQKQLRDIFAQLCKRPKPQAEAKE